MSRAGAGTISELCIVGKPVVLVPSPNVSEDHQTKNALALVEKDAAILVKDGDAKKVMVQEVLDLMKDKNRMAEMRVNLKELAKPNADELIVDEVLKLIN